VNTVPTRLVRFQAELESAIARERARRPRRLAVRTTVVAAAAAAVTLGVLGALPGNEPSVVERAAAALRAVDGTILHTVLVGTMTEPGGTSTAVRIETWQASSSPFDERQITVAGGRRVEVASSDGVPQLYDAQTNTIYTSTAAPEAAKPATAGDPYRAKILGLLDAGKLHEGGHAVVDGRDAIRLASEDGSVTLLVAPGTYEPIEWRVGQNGQTAVARFPIYERLPATEAGTLFDLRAQHAGATVDDDPADYEAAQQRLSPKVR
jgi:hypothetical protein